MLRIVVVTLFPEMLAAITEFGITGRAVRNSLLEIKTINPRDYAEDAHNTVDDRPYGGGPGMVMLAQPLKEAVLAAKELLPAAKVIYMSPQGKRLEQQYVQELAVGNELILIAGRYEGIDERFIKDYVDAEWSIGDYVLSGGELPAMVLIDAMARMVPGVLGHEDSADQDSFIKGVLDYPHYTRPEQWENQTVPKVLLNGNHQAIARWRIQQALGRTWQRRPDLIEKMALNAEQQTLLDEFINEQTNN